MEAHSSPSLVINLLGTFDVRVDGVPVLGWRSEKTKWLLAYLVLHPGAATYSSLQGMLGTSDVASLENECANVRQSVANLCKQLGHGRFPKPTRSSVLLDRDDMETDIATFDAAIQEGGIAALRRAVALYSGPLLPDCQEPWIATPRATRAQQYAQALRHLAQEAIGSGNNRDGEGYLRLEIAADPIKEDVRCDLMRLLAQRGEYNAALQVYRDFLDFLSADPRARPGPHLTALYHDTQARQQEKARLSTGEDPTCARPWQFPAPLAAPIGREDALNAVGARLLLNRLVTLTGPPGVGKTRLALHAALAAPAGFLDGGWFLELAEQGSRRDIVRRMLVQMEVSVGQRTEEEALVAFLQGRQALLVLDNCEHLLAACVPLVRDLLAQCPRLHILATSRQALDITGESVYAVPPLSCPNAALLRRPARDLATLLLAFPAVRLFVQRAGETGTTFALTPENAKCVGLLCHRLEGLPLALELLAGWADALSAKQMLVRLDTPLAAPPGTRVDAPARHRSLETAIATSFSLLAPPLQRLFAQLSVFQGGWTLEAAPSVCDAPASPAEVRDLHKRSLVTAAEGEGVRRFRQLEPLRAFAQAQLSGSKRAALARRHALHFLGLALEAEPCLRGVAQTDWLQRLEAEHDNFRAALAWTLAEEGQADTGLQLAGALWGFWYARGHACEGQEWLDRLLERDTERADTAGLVRLKALGAAGNLAFGRADYANAHRFFTRHLALAETLSHRRAQAAALGSLANLASEAGDYAAAREFFARCLGVFRELDDKRNTALTLGNLAVLAFRERDCAQACALHAESLTLLKEHGDPLNVALALNNLAEAKLAQEEHTQAHGLLARSLALGLGLDSKRVLLHGLSLACALAMRREQRERAARLLGAVETLRDEAGQPLSPSALEEHRSIRRRLQERLGRQKAELLMAEGRAWTLAEACAAALEGDDGSAEVGV